MVLTRQELKAFTDPIEAVVAKYVQARSEENRLRLEVEIITSLQQAFEAGRQSTIRHPLPCKKA